MVIVVLYDYPLSSLSLDDGSQPENFKIAKPSCLSADGTVKAGTALKFSLCLQCSVRATCYDVFPLPATAKSVTTLSVLHDDACFSVSLCLSE